MDIDRCIEFADNEHIIPCNLNEIFYVSRVLYANRTDEFIPEGVAKYIVTQININEGVEEVVLKHQGSEHELHIAGFNNFKNEIGKTIFKSEGDLIQALREFVATL